MGKDTSDVVDWDEYGQGYNADGKLIICICGQRVTPGGVGHYCVYDDGPEDG